MPGLTRYLLDNVLTRRRDVFHGMLNLIQHGVFNEEFAQPTEELAQPKEEVDQARKEVRQQ